MSIHSVSIVTRLNKDNQRCYEHCGCGATREKDANGNVVVHQGRRGDWDEDGWHTCKLCTHDWFHKALDTDEEPESPAHL